jgi:gamma-butyrobetaine dioxygenase
MAIWFGNSGSGERRVGMTGDVVCGANGLKLVLPGVGQQYFNFHWLRDNCSTSFDPQTRERTYNIFARHTAPVPQSAQLDDGVLEISWADENHVSRYPLDWLARCAAGRRPDPADLPRRAWYADHYAKMHRVGFADLAADKAARRDWFKALLVDGVAMVTGMPDSDEALKEIVEHIGLVRPTFFGDYFDVRTHIEPSNLAYTAKALELHTDVPAEELAPGIQFLHCRANSVTGGDNLFLDGLAAAEDLRREFPEDFRLLSEIDVPFNCEHDAFDMRARQRVIELDEHGHITGLTVSLHLADVFDLPQQMLDDYYPAFCRFGKMLYDPKYLMRFNIRPGECIVFDNHRIVHGRDAYSATSGDRYLRGCYADRGELRSAYRVLANADETA